MQNHGTIASFAGSLGGFTTKGVTSNSLGVGVVSGTSGAARSGETWTFTWISGCTVSGTCIFTGVNASVNFLGTDTTAMSFIGSGTPSESWSVS